MAIRANERDAGVHSGRLLQRRMDVVEFRWGLVGLQLVDNSLKHQDLCRVVMHLLLNDGFNVLEAVLKSLDLCCHLCLNLVE